MCIDSLTINKIIVKYWFSILRLDDILDMMSGVTIFSLLFISKLTIKSRWLVGV